MGRAAQRKRERRIDGCAQVLRRGPEPVKSPRAKPAYEDYPFEEIASAAEKLIQQGAVIFIKWCRRPRLTPPDQRQDLLITVRP